MAIEVTMPQMGADMTEGTVLKWLKNVGDTVQRGDVIAEIETDKANIELEAFESGTLIKLVANEGDLVPVGDVIALLGEPGEQAPEAPAAPPEPARPATRRGTGEPRPAAPAPGSATVVEREPAPAAGERQRVSPVAKRIAAQSGVNLENLTGTGPGGRILRRDVEAAIAGAEAAPVVATAAPRPGPAPTPPAGVESLSRMRQAIARRMTQSKQQQPHYYLTLDIDMTPALAFRAQFNEAADDEQRASINDLVVKACAIALRRYPKFTARFTDEGLAYPGAINVDIGIALDEGLIAPSLLDCGTKSLGQIAAGSKGLVERARANRLRSDEYGQGCFTITNLGAYGVETLIGIINPPQAAILGVGSVMPKPVVIDDTVVIRQVMKVALSADHRVTDGAEGARFIKAIQEVLENPASLAL